MNIGAKILNQILANQIWLYINMDTISWLNHKNGLYNNTKISQCNSPYFHTMKEKLDDYFK